MIASETKTCFKCGEIKPLAAFYRHPMMKDGHVNKCKICNKKDVAEYRTKNIDKIRAYDRNRGNRHSPGYTKEWRSKNPLKHKAHKIVRYQVKRGNLVIKPCEVCGSKKVVAHHDNYNEPLNVRWMCQSHHKQWHVHNVSIGI